LFFIRLEKEHQSARAAISEAHAATEDAVKSKVNIALINKCS